MSQAAVLTPTDAFVKVKQNVDTRPKDSEVSVIPQMITLGGGLGDSPSAGEGAV